MLKVRLVLPVAVLLTVGTGGDAGFFIPGNLLCPVNLLTNGIS